MASKLLVYTDFVLGRCQVFIKKLRFFSCTYTINILPCLSTCSPIHFNVSLSPTPLNMWMGVPNEISWQKLKNTFTYIFFTFQDDICVKLLLCSYDHATYLEFFIFLLNIITSRLCIIFIILKQPVFSNYMYYSL